MQRLAEIPAGKHRIQSPSAPPYPVDAILCRHGGNFFKIEVKEDLPYESGPWPCANKLCSHYRKDVAMQLEISKKWNEIWAWFECPHCGMCYRMSDPGQSFEEYLKKPYNSDLPGANASAVMYSMIETAKANILNVFQYLYMVLLYMPDYKNEPEGIEQLLPWSDFIKEHCTGLIDVENITAEKHEPMPI